MNKTIDISQYIASNCDFLKKNCSFKGDVNLEEGEYILQVRICNTISACETKEVKFTVFPIKPGSWIDIVLKWITRVRCDYSLWATLSGSGCNSADDPDNDCIRNISGCDNCPDVANPEQKDTDEDGIGDACDNCKYEYNPDQANSDGDSFGNRCDNCVYIINDRQYDRDNDNIGDDCDNCPDVANADQSDWNKNGKGDACEDSDGDGITDEDEIKKYNTSPSNKDTDGDGVDDKMEILWGTDPN